MLPLLRELAKQGETRTTELVQAMADRFGLSLQERSALLPSGRQSIIANRTHWAIAYLTKSGLIERPRRAHYKLADRGAKALSRAPDRIDLKYLARYPEFAAFQGENTSSGVNPAAIETEATPDELIANAHKQIEAALRNDIIERILQRDPYIFRGAGPPGTLGDGLRWG